MGSTRSNNSRAEQTPSDWEAARTFARLLLFHFNTFLDLDKRQKLAVGGTQMETRTKRLFYIHRNHLERMSAAFPFKSKNRHSEIKFWDKLRGMRVLGLRKGKKRDENESLERCRGRKQKLHVITVSRGEGEKNEIWCGPKREFGRILDLLNSD